MTDLNAIQLKLAGHKAKVLLLTCIDLRFHLEIAKMMKDHFHYEGQYDQTILAGASLGTQLTFGPDRKPHWQQTFLEMLALSIEVHDTDGMIVMDHMDCGAFKRYWNSMGVGPYSERKEEERHHFFMDSLSVLVKNEVKNIKPLFFVIQWLLPKPSDDKSNFNDPSKWSLKLVE